MATATAATELAAYLSIWLSLPLSSGYDVVMEFGYGFRMALALGINCKDIL